MEKINKIFICYVKIFICYLADGEGCHQLWRMLKIDIHLLDYKEVVIRYLVNVEDGHLQRRLSSGIWQMEHVGLCFLTDGQVCPPLFGRWR